MRVELFDELKKYIPEVEDYEIEIVEQFYTLALKKHPENDEKLLRIYLFGHLLTSLDEYEFSKVQISNITLEENENSNNIYLNMYENLLKTFGKSNEEDVAIVSII